ncbi:MAG: hypothetical protein ABGY95_07185 [Rubritalea sp.]|uniref:hypothetical protein n=1 Tax=Rubritalea sp. TaxID=2109375 RepID=UPI00324234C2
MSDEVQAERLKVLPQCWQLWSNPLFHRYRRSRLRLGSLITGVLLYGGTSLLFYLMALGFTMTQTDLPFERTAVYPFGFLVLLQLFILNFVGTGEVAAGMARESVDEVLTYQRLTPLSPATKIIGYLFGLPVRQFYHFILTLPVTSIIIITGQIPAKIWIPIYAVLFTSTLMFYLLAMSVGFIMGKRFSALISQGLVALLYFALPQLSNFGFVIFEYLTIRPALLAAASNMLPMVDMFEHDQYALFYNWEVSHTIYCIILQCLIAWIFYSLMLRRWRSESSHLLSKFQCVVIAGMLHVIILGGIWANTSNGSMFNVEIQTRTPVMAGLQKTVAENVEIIAATVLSLYGLIGFSFAILLQYIYTPDKFRYLAGLRERKNQAKTPYAILSDSASGIPSSLLIAVITTAAWLLYSSHLATSPKVMEYIAHKSWKLVDAMLIAVSVTTLLSHAFSLEYLGKKLNATIACFIWVIPLAVALLLSAWNFGQKASSFIYGLSPLAMDFSPGYIMASIHNSEDPTLFIYGCKVGVLFYLIIGLYSLSRIILRHKRSMRLRDIV